MASERISRSSTKPEIGARLFVGAMRPLAALPQPVSRFIGRRVELEELGLSVLNNRMVTVFGPAGCGKTRLVIEVATAVAEHCADGVAFVDLSVLRDDSLVAESVATALGLKAEASAEMAELVGHAQLLLVIDNAEHLIDGVAALVERLISSCPRLRIVVTSRELLDIGGERCWRLPSLSLPPPSLLGIPYAVDQLSEFDAVNLFCTRATEHEPAFRLGADNAELVLAICQRLDGIPLALELAAAWVGRMALPDVVARLTEVFGLLTHGSRTAIGRHRTLRATMDWSYALLDESERQLLGELSIFVPTYDLAAVEAVCSTPTVGRDRVADVLRRLVDKSLVQTYPALDGGLRYALTEVVRQYGHKRLASSAVPDLEGRHARYYARLAQRIDATEAEVKTRAERISVEYANMRLALDSARSDGSAVEERIIRALSWYWRLRGSVKEAQDRIRAALEASGDSAAWRGFLLAEAATWSRKAGDLEAALKYINQAMALSEEIGDPRFSSRVADIRGVILSTMGDHVAAERDIRGAVELLRSVSPCGELVMSLNNLALVLLLSGRPEEALENIRQALEAKEHLSVQPLWLASMVHTLGLVLLNLERIGEARDQFLSGLECAAEYGNYEAAIAHLQGLACTMAAAGHPAVALELLGAARTCARLAGVKEQWVASTPSAPKAEDACREALGKHAAEAAWRRGLRIDLKASIQLVRTWDGKEGQLTTRKREIVRMLAAGLSNKEIARRLSISPRTVDVHLDQVRHQLGARNRAQIVAWALSSEYGTQQP